jgi:DNA modification methylase
MSNGQQNSQKAYLLTGTASDYLQVSVTNGDFMTNPFDNVSSRNRDTIFSETEDKPAAASLDRQAEIVPLEGLTPYKNNARTHSKAQIRQIADSIARFGFNSPVLIDDEGQIVAGHGRVAAAKQLGLNAVPARRLSHLSEAEKRAYVLADNKLAEKAGWDRETLAIELQGLIEIDFEVELTGFEVPEIDVILEDADAAKAESEGPEDDIPEPQADGCITRPGDVWVLGKHRIICGNALDEADYGRLLGDEKAEFVFTDPPYNVRIDGNVCGKGAIHHREFVMGSGEMTREAFTKFLTTAFRHLVAHSKDGSIHDVCMDWRHIAEMMDAGNLVYSELKNLCVWTKKNAGMGTFYRSRHELVFVWKSGTAAHINNFKLGQHGRTRTNVWEYAGITSMGPERLEQLAMHPTVKPIALVADAIRDCSRRNGIVLDPFLGSGTTVIAAERTGRRARGIELDPAYVDVIIKRWQSYTGKSVVLAATGQTFEDVTEECASSATASAVEQPQPSTMQRTA